MKSNAGRSITINVGPENIRAGIAAGAGMHGMIVSALRESGYKDSIVGDTTVEVSTRAGHRWLGTVHPTLTKKLVASMSLKARPARVKPFSITLRIFRDENYITPMPTDFAKAA